MTSASGPGVGVGSEVGWGVAVGAGVGPGVGAAVAVGCGPSIAVPASSAGPAGSLAPSAPPHPVITNATTNTSAKRTSTRTEGRTGPLGSVPTAARSPASDRRPRTHCAALVETRTIGARSTRADILDTPTIKPGTIAAGTAGARTIGGHTWRDDFSPSWLLSSPDLTRTRKHLSCIIDAQQCTTPRLRCNRDLDPALRRMRRQQEDPPSPPADQMSPHRWASHPPPHRARHRPAVGLDRFELDANPVTCPPGLSGDLARHGHVRATGKPGGCRSRGLRSEWARPPPQRRRHQRQRRRPRTSPVTPLLRPCL